MDIAFERGLGVSRQALASAVIAARFDHVVRCLNRLGYEASPADFPVSMDPPAPPLFGGVAEDALRALESFARSPSAPSPSPGRDEATSQCYQEAADSLPDPTDAFFEWLSQEAADLAGRTMADPRVVAAQVTETECLAALGISDSPNEISGRFVQQADDVLHSYRNATLDLDDARAELREMAAEEAAIAPGIADCIRQRVRAQDAVYNEYEQEFVEQHAQAVADQVALAQDKLLAYQAYLED